MEDKMPLVPILVAFTLGTTLLWFFFCAIRAPISSLGHENLRDQSATGLTIRRTVLITGCSQGGIGDALAQEFHRNGLRVFATARNLSKIQHLKSMGMEILSLDVTDKASIEHAVRTLREADCGYLDILVNNAGGGYSMPLMDSELSLGQALFNLNVFPIMTVTQAFLPLLMASQGTVINIGSIVESCPLCWQALYNASKAAVASLSDSMRLELALLGIKVIHVITGGVKTNFWTNVLGETTGESLPENSLYAPVKDELDPFLKGSGFEKDKVLPEAYAALVVKNALKKRPKRHLWVGGKSSVIWAATTFLWRSSWDLRIALPRYFNLSMIGRKLRAAGPPMNKGK